MTLDQFLLGGRAAEIILLLVVAEIAVLAWRRRAGQGAPVQRWLPPLLSGMALVMALRLVQGEAPLPLLGLCLTAAGIAHAWGYRARWYS